MPSLFSANRPVAFARVAVERAVDRYPEGLTYGVPADLAGIEPGERVVVPLGRGDRPAPGWVVEIIEEPEDSGEIKNIGSREAAGGRLPPSLMALAKWIASYYCAPLGLAVAAMLPAAVKRNTGAVSRTYVDLAEAGEGEAPAERLPAKQQAILDALASAAPEDRPLEIRALADRAGIRTTGPVRRLLDRGLLKREERTTIEAAWPVSAADARAPEALTPAQAAAVAAIAATFPGQDARAPGGSPCGGFSAHLLFGVTGSGKTEVYIRLIEAALARKRVAIVLVPEISLTPQTGGRLLGRFPGRGVSVLHSGLTAAQRHQQWVLAASGRASIILGARSAVFAPVDDASLGLIIVDEEHDGSYKQDQTPRYHGRDVAIRRAQQAGCPIVLGSATPSLESWINATERGLYTLHRLPERVPGMRLPSVRVVDLAEQLRARPRKMGLIGPVLEGAIEKTLAQGGQVLLLLNRRGYANYLACANRVCGWILSCEHCDVSMVYHRHGAVPAGGFVRCHHCESALRVPKQCPACAGRLTTLGLGTQRVEEELAGAFPALARAGAMARVDSDAMRSARDFESLLAAFGAGEIRLLVGTQMIAKGLDYPNVRLVGVINADTALSLPDFRSAERTFQLVSQVAGRCGRSTEPGALGLVIVQSFNPATPAIRLAALHDYETFARQELDSRRTVSLPPIRRMARIVLRDTDAERCASAAEVVADGLRALASQEVEVRGPAPCPIARIADHHRRQVEVLAPAPAQLQRLLAAARNRGLLRPGRSMAIDVDPVALF